MSALMLACYFCSTNSETVSAGVIDGSMIYCEICGDYAVDRLLNVSLTRQETKISLNQQLNCSEQNIRDRENALIPVWYTHKSNDKLPEGFVARSLELFEDIPIIHSSKIEGLLKTLAVKTSQGNPFQDSFFTLRDLRNFRIANMDELASWIDILMNQGLIHGPLFKRAKKMLGLKMAAELPPIAFQITPRGRS